jgi:hypothetical protein
MSQMGQTRPPPTIGRLVDAGPVLLRKRTHFGPVGSGQPWGPFRHFWYCSRVFDQTHPQRAFWHRPVISAEEAPPGEIEGRAHADHSWRFS